MQAKRIIPGQNIDVYSRFDNSQTNTRILIFNNDFSSVQASHAGAWEQDLGGSGVPQQMDSRDASEGEPQADIGQWAG